MGSGEAEMAIAMETKLDEPRPTERFAAPAPHIKWRHALGLREMGVYYAVALLVVVLAALTARMGHSNYLSVLNLTT